MKFLLLTILFVLALPLSGENQEVSIPKFETIQDVREAFKSHDLCLIVKLLQYTDYLGKPLDHQNTFVGGMEFEVIWNVGEVKKKYWVHICGEPTKDEIYGPTQKIYALTFEGLIFPDDEPKPDWWPWGGCADYYRFYQIKIEQGDGGKRDK